MRKFAVIWIINGLLLGGLLVPPATAGSNRVVSSASGSGHMERNGFFRTFSFTAEKFADGTSTGQLQLRSPEFDVVVHLRVDCLRVVGGQAHMSGVITYTSDPSEAFVGERNRLVVQDNGSGPHAPPDMVSGIPANPENQNTETCENNTLTPNRVVDAGNVRVQD